MLTGGKFFPPSRRERVRMRGFAHYGFSPWLCRRRLLPPIA
jgi:hypothetical protein